MDECDLPLLEKKGKGRSQQFDPIHVFVRPLFIHAALPYEPVCPPPD